MTTANDPYVFYGTCRWEERFNKEVTDDGYNQSTSRDIQAFYVSLLCEDRSLKNTQIVLKLKGYTQIFCMKCEVLLFSTTIEDGHSYVAIFKWPNTVRHPGRMLPTMTHTVGETLSPVDANDHVAISFSTSNNNTYEKHNKKIASSNDLSRFCSYSAIQRVI